MNHHNAYTKTFPNFFDACPKSVFAAVAASFGTVGGDYLEEASYRIACEWQTLFEQGIVSQPLTAIAKKTIELGKARGYKTAFGGE